ncbi:MAG: leucine-rich repeat-containing 48 isoform 1 [Trebouxia sp. A1-2]|nr:MAG: leucine-rich repeat-containing 48 isoform 1 [Trebouxia sp. A1-2]
MGGPLSLAPQKEENVITEALTRQCIQGVSTQAADIQQQQKTMQYKDIEHLAFGFRHLVQIDHLHGLVNLKKLQLDNNCLTKIENLDHLINLTWLDLSFNSITRLEGLSKLKKLTDLSLFSNKLERIENIETLQDLVVLSLGRNNISAFDNVMYLRQFKKLRLINLAGNPIAVLPDYRSYVLSHIKDLTYLDYRRVNAADVASAIEQHQDEMIELGEKEAIEAVADKEAAETAAHVALMKEANLEGIETLLEDMVKADAEWAKLGQVPGLVDGWTDALMLEQHEKKKSEYQEWWTVVEQAMVQKDTAAKQVVLTFQKTKKHVFRSIEERTEEEPDKSEELLADLAMKRSGLAESLSKLEVESREILLELLAEFDRRYSDIAEADRGHYTTYFATVRDLDSRFYEACNTTALLSLEKYGQEGSDLEALPEEARTLLQDKDTLLNAVQASHDAHGTVLDGIEDRLTSHEIKSAASLVGRIPVLLSQLPT